MIKLKALLPEVWDANLLEQSESFIVFCDMDGVMCDFDLQFTQMIGSSPKEFEAQYGTLKFWNEIVILTNCFGQVWKRCLILLNLKMV